MYKYKNWREELLGSSNGPRSSVLYFTYDGAKKNNFQNILFL